MNKNHISEISATLNLNKNQIKAVSDLLDEGATIPFIARYRKEVTGSMDEVAVTLVRDHLARLEELDSRKKAVLKSLEQHGHLNEELEQKVNTAPTLAELEDIYLPYRPKRRTKATIAREKGLEPLALMIFEQTGIDPEAEAEPFLDAEKAVEQIEDALKGARDIIAEMINEDQNARALLRKHFAEKGVFKSTVAKDMEEKGAKYKDYFDWQEPVSLAPSHRVLAMRRGEKQDILNLGIAPPEEQAIAILEDLFIKAKGKDADQVGLAIHDSYKRLLSRSMETEIRVKTKEKADSEAIRVFADNLRQLLLASPLGAKRVMGIDPGFRTGCKVVCLDRQGKLLHNETIFPHTSNKQKEQAKKSIKGLADQFNIEAIAVGNGTAGRETESFIRSLSLDKKIQVILVNESGASIYSASKIARQEFPDHDLTVRGAVSIGRRLMDPLSELVKIDPKSIGVGQYQHDVDPFALKESLDDVVVSCVNAVGVEVNQASVQLLTYVSGLGPVLAKNIVAYRDENGAFKSRTELKKVNRLGPKAFEQCAGFLRIKDGENPLDAGAVHPESYDVVYEMAKDQNCTVTDLVSDQKQRDRIDLNAYVTDTIGLPTLNDILQELSKPGRDPRKEFEVFNFADGIDKIEDLYEGMKLPGVVTNVTAFGAFVDMGVHQDGLVHISELSDNFVKDPSTIVKVQQKVTVTVLNVDLPRKRISLSMKSNPGEKRKKAQPHAGRKKPRPTAGVAASKNKKKNRDNRKTPFNNPFADLFQKQ